MAKADRNELTPSRPKVNVNPFAQPHGLWQLSLRVPTAMLAPLEEEFEAASLAFSTFEDAPDASFWSVQALMDRPPDMPRARETLARIAARLGVPVPEIACARVEQGDWRASLERDFPPLRIGRFFVHGAHAKAAAPPHAVSIQVEAGLAFGSGEHATTSGCLLALDGLAKRRKFTRVLDMGCGSGILAIAAAKCWPKARVLAVDVDPVSVRVTRENSRINRVVSRLKAVEADRYEDGAVSGHGPYDLILSNILARPLVKMSRGLAADLKAGGVAVLSGLLASQETFVLAAHRAQGLQLTGRIARDGWVTLILTR